MRILVTGAAGFIGSHLARRLAREGHDVIAADAFISAPWQNLADFTGDVLTLRDHDDVGSMTALGPFDSILHQASVTGVVDPAGKSLVDQPGFTNSAMRSNVEVFRALLAHAADTGARVVWASSCSVYGQGPVPMKEDQPPQPLNVYAFSKLAMERLAERYASKLSRPAIALRYSNVYGPGEHHKGKLASIIHQLAVQMRAGRRPRIFTAGQQKRDFVYIEDVVEANLRALEAKEGGAFNIGAGAAWSFNEVVAELNRALGTDLEPDYFDNPYGFTQEWTQCDLTRSHEALGYEPRFDLGAGIAAYHASGQLGGTGA